MNRDQHSLSRFSIKELWRPFLAKVPLRFRAAILQKERTWSTSILKGMLTLWTFWFVGLIFFSDLQKQSQYRVPYILIRLGVVTTSIAIQFFLRRETIRRETVSIVTLFLASLYLGSYVGFSFLPLPIRTTWVTILPAAFILTTPKSGRAAFFSYIALTIAGLVVFHQQINTIWVVSDILFGFVLIGGGLLIKDLWIKSIVLMLEQEEAQRLSLQNEISILEAVESFIPKGIRTMIRSGVSAGQPISDIIKAMSKPKEQHIAVLYSDYRNYSVQSASIEFVEKELILSSQKIIEFAEEQNAIVQNAGDSILATFTGASNEYNVARALYSGIMAAKAEFDRVKNRNNSDPDRYMIVTSGQAVFCSLGNNSRQEITIAGKPANLANRLDELTKNPILKVQVASSPCVLFDYQTKSELKTSGINIQYEEIDLKNSNLAVRTYSEERRIFLLRYSLETLEALNCYLKSPRNIREAA
jgi:class 3 adenylate cyclase